MMAMNTIMVPPFFMTLAKPESLIQHFVEILSNPNDCVLDPFMGSGTTGVVSKRTDSRPPTPANKSITFGFIVTPPVFVPGQF